VADCRVVRVSPVVWLLVQRGRVVGILIVGAAPVLLGQKLLDLPIVLLDADGKLEIFARDGIPVLFLDWLAELELLDFSGATNLVHHHDCEKIADSREKEAVKIMLHAVADGVAEDVKNDLTNHEEEDAKRDVAQWPAILERAHNKDDLAGDVDKQENGVHNVGDDEDSNGVSGAQTGPVLEGEQRDSTTDQEHGEGAQAQQPDRQCCAVLVQLESDEAVDQQAGAECGCKAVLGGGKVWIRRGPGGSDAGVEDKRYYSEEEVDVEEGRDFLATCVRSQCLSRAARRCATYRQR
jgi:hypothetical protein